MREEDDDDIHFVGNKQHSSTLSGDKRKGNVRRSVLQIFQPNRRESGRVGCCSISVSSCLLILP